MTPGGQMSRRLSFEYFVLRCVPRVDREEFVNVGVVLFCSETGFLGALHRVDPERLRALAPGIDPAAVGAARDTIEAICRADASGGPVAAQPPRFRFGWLSSPRSTVVQPGPVHGGLTDDPAGQLAHLLGCLVG
jgi:hypothetical protein